MQSGPARPPGHTLWDQIIRVCAKCTPSSNCKLDTFPVSVRDGWVCNVHYGSGFVMNEEAMVPGSSAARVRTPYRVFQ